MRRIVAVMMSTFVGLMAWIAVDGLHDRVSHSDVAVVLGSMVTADGTVSNRLRARLDKTVELYRQGLFGCIVVSGGVGAEGVDEAQVMMNYLVSNQVPPSAIVVDSSGANTLFTARFSAALMRRHGFTSALIITQYFHVPRTRYALHTQGVGIVNNAHPSFYEWRDLYSIAREAVALPSYWLSSNF